jgi:hypothetical protein
MNKTTQQKFGELSRLFFFDLFFFDETAQALQAQTAGDSSFPDAVDRNDVRQIKTRAGGFTG